MDMKRALLAFALTLNAIPALADDNSADKRSGSNDSEPVALEEAWQNPRQPDFDSIQAREKFENRVVGICAAGAACLMGPLGFYLAGPASDWRHNLLMGMLTGIG